MTRGLIDSSVFVALESRGLDRSALPDDGWVSVVTRAELTLGVLAAANDEIRGQRLDTLTGIAAFGLIPISGPVADRWAQMRVVLSKHSRRVNVNDLWIAATASVHDLPVVTQDTDFDVIAELTDLEVIHV